MTGNLQRGLVIINDHQFLSDLLGGLLKDQGFEWIKSFTEAETGLAYILANPPDLVIIDMMLPIMRTHSHDEPGTAKGIQALEPASGKGFVGWRMGHDGS